MIFAGYFL